MKPLRPFSPAAAAAMAAALLALPLAAQTPGPEPAPAPPIVPAQPPVQPPSADPSPAPAMSRHPVRRLAPLVPALPLVPAHPVAESPAAAPDPFASVDVPSTPEDGPQSAGAAPPVPPPPVVNRPADWPRAASILEVDCNILEERLRRMAPAHRSDPDTSDIEPRGVNHFPYARTLNYEVWGMVVTASMLSGTPSPYRSTPRISIHLPHEALNEESWSLLIRALGLPADTPLPHPPAQPGEVTEKDSHLIPGAGVNWVAIVNDPFGGAAILIGSRGIYETPQALVADKPNKEALARAFDEFSYQTLKSRR